MKRLLPLLLLVAALPSRGAIALVANAKGVSTNTNDAVSTAINSGGANLIIAVVNIYSADATAVALSDNKGNTWTACTPDYSFAPGHIAVWYSTPTTIGSGHTVTVATSGAYPSIFVTAWSGAAASSPCDQSNGHGSGSGTTERPGNITPSEADELVITAINITSSTVAPTITAPYGPVLDMQLDNTVQTGAIAYNVQTSATVTDPTWTINNELNRVAVIASFRAAGGGSDGVRRRVILCQ
jgi:hypothetical protein